MTTFSHAVRLPLAVAAVLTTITFAHTDVALASPTCPNEQLRSESNINPATNEPYDSQLPECRAYEMVSPLEKGSRRAEPADAPGILVAPAGATVGFQSEGAFAGAANVPVTNVPLVDYLSTRSPTGWHTMSTEAPASIIASPTTNGLHADFTSTLDTEISCGKGTAEGPGNSSNLRCAVRELSSEWLATPLFTTLTGSVNQTYSEPLLGTAAGGTRAFIQPTQPLLAEDSGITGSQGIYELAGLGTASQTLRLVNVASNGTELTGEPEGSLTRGPRLGNSRGTPEINGSAYQAISEDGETVFFTARPNATQQPSGEQLTIYARLHHNETVAVSNPTPSECTTCNPTPQPATYQGASASGEKVFFTSAQQLVNSDTDGTPDLYEYDFASPTGHHLIQLSKGGPGDFTPGAGANVQGVVATASNGEHVYFVATGVLTTLRNSFGEQAQAGADNLYGVDTATLETKFIADLCSGPDETGADNDSKCSTPDSDAALWEEDASATRETQTTDDGQFLAFSTNAQLAPEDRNDSQAAYRYNFSSGELTWISHPASGFTITANGGAGEGKNAEIAPINYNFGAERDVNDWNRAISESGEDIIFTTAEQLQADDQNKAADVYLWHNGEVHMISDGQSTGVGARQTLTESPFAGMSANGSDIFFFTSTKLVGQDEDELQDLYDARVDGGFPAPTSEPSCAGEECQGTLALVPEALRAGGSSTATATGNLAAVPFVVTAIEEPKPAASGVKITAHSTNTLSVKTSAAGALSLTGAGLATTKKTTSKAGTYALAVTLTSAEKKLLTKRGHLTLTVTVKFVPTSGKPSTAKAKITIRSQMKKKSKK